MNIYGVTGANGYALSRWEVNELLEEMGIDDDTIDKGSTAIEKEAKEKKIDLTLLPELAKTQGANGVNGSVDKNKEGFEAELTKLGIPDATIAKGREAVIAYAAQNNIELPKPPQGAQLNLIS